MTRSLGSVWCGVALASLLVGATGCDAIGRRKVESGLATAASGCRVRFEGPSNQILKVSPCVDGESTARARQYVSEHCAEIRSADIRIIGIETWNAPRYQSMNWSSMENDTCTTRCIGSGC